jgi:hypothetical protein
MYKMGPLSWTPPRGQAAAHRACPRAVLVGWNSGAPEQILCYPPNPLPRRPTARPASKTVGGVVVACVT